MQLFESQKLKTIKIDVKYSTSDTIRCRDSGANLFIGDKLDMDVFCGRKKKAK